LQYCSEDEAVIEIEEKLRKLDSYFIDLNKPEDFNPQSLTNAVLMYEKNLEQLISLLETNKIHAPDNLSLFQFYGRLKYIKETTQKQTRNN
jgi:hypothetical protein